MISVRVKNATVCNYIHHMSPDLFGMEWSVSVFNYIHLMVFFIRVFESGLGVTTPI